MKDDNPMKIKHKLILLILAITLFTMLVSIGFMFFRDLAQFRRDSLNSIQTIANITAINTVAEVVFSDREEAVRSLSQLQYLDDFVFAALFHKDRELLAGFPLENELDIGRSYTELLQETKKNDGFFRVMRPVTYKDELVGTIYLKFSSQSFNKKVRDYLVSIAFFTVILIVIVLVLTLKAQGLVSGPIMILTDFVKKVSTQRDYSLRIKKKSSDEIGLLYDGFNTMLSVIEDHQGDLKRYHEHLEELVEDRTRELLEMNAEMVKLNKAVEYSPNIVTILDNEGRVQYVNPKFEEITGYKRSEVEGQLASFMNRRYHDEISYMNMKQALKNGEDWSGEILNTRKDGSEYWEKISVSCVRDKKGDISHYIEVAEDNSARKAAEVFLRNAKEVAERANRLKSEFLANMSHEIRTPMNAILGYAKLLLEGENDENRRRQLEIINISGENLLVIINDVLDFSKIEANKLELVLNTFSIRDLLDHLEKMFSIKAEEKQLFMKMYVDTPLPKCLYGDRSRLQQILINIIGNAIKFTRTGGVTVSVSYNEPGHLFISVSDTGVGIPETFQKFIFEPFTQADGSATREFGGTGLGLTIAYNLLRLMGGEMKLDSREGNGSTFRIQIPIVRCEEDWDISEDETDSREFSQNVKGRIGLIEDNEDDRRILTEQLETNGFEVIFLDSAQNLASQVVDRCIDLVIYDVRIEGGNCCVLNRQLKQDARTRKVPIVAFFGNDQEDGGTSVHFGVIDYLKKPVRDDDITAFLDSIQNLKGQIRTVFIVDEDPTQLIQYRDLLKEFNFSILSFTTTQDALHEIYEGFVPDLLILDPSLSDMNESSFLDELASLPLTLPVMVLTGKALHAEALTDLSQKTAHLLKKTRQSYREFLVFINSFFKQYDGCGQAMVDRWLSKCNGDVELKQIVITGLKSLPLAVKRLGDSIDANDLDQIRFNAHSLKGMATNLFMDEVGQITRQIDEEVRREPVSMSNIRILFQELVSIVEAIPEGYSGEKVKKEMEKKETGMFKGIDILIAEDDPINQQLMQDYFNIRGLEVDIAENGRVVLDKLNARSYDLLLLDMQMPVMDGLETIKLIRQDARYKSIYVIALTGHAMRGDREKYLEAGCNDYLSKPVNFNELQKKIDQRIEKVNASKKN